MVPLGNSGGLNVAVSPVPMLLTSNSQCLISRSESMAARTQRAPWRPRDPSSSVGATLRPATAEMRSRAAFVHFTVSGCPCAYPTKTCDNGPTCVGLPSKRGAFTQVYFPSGDQSVYCGVVSPCQGCKAGLLLE